MDKTKAKKKGPQYTSKVVVLGNASMINVYLIRSI